MPAAVLGELHVSSSSVPPRSVPAPRSRPISCVGCDGNVVLPPKLPPRMPLSLTHDWPEKAAAPLHDNAVVELT